LRSKSRAAGAWLCGLCLALAGCYPQSGGIPTLAPGARLLPTEAAPAVFAATATSPPPAPTPTDIPTAAPTTAPTAAPTLAPQAVTATPAPPVDPLTFTGSGSHTAGPVRLYRRLTVFRFRHDGAASFNVSLVDSRGQTIGVLIDTLGYVDGGSALFLDGEGDYTLAIAADGPWSVTVEQPVMDSAPPLPNPLEGRAAQVSPRFFLQAGLAVFRVSYAGPGIFTLTLFDQSGQIRSELFNTTGAFAGSRAVKIARGDIFLLNIRADGQWMLSVEQ
jgi:hypothetical protein